MKNKKYVISFLYEINPYADILFLIYILKRYLFTSSEKAAAIIFILAWLSFFIVATRQFLNFWKGHFCTGMVHDEKIFASYYALSLLSLTAQALAFIEFKTPANAMLLAVITLVNIMSIISYRHYLSLIFFAFNYFLFFFRIIYLIKLV